MCSRFYQWYQWYTNIVQGSTNGTIGNTIGTNGNANGTIGRTSNRAYDNVWVTGHFGPFLIAHNEVLYDERVILLPSDCPMGALIFPSYIGYAA